MGQSMCVCVLFYMVVNNVSIVDPIVVGSFWLPAKKVKKKFKENRSSNPTTSHFLFFFSLYSPLIGYTEEE